MVIATNTVYQKIADLTTPFCPEYLTKVLHLCFYFFYLRNLWLHLPSCALTEMAAFAYNRASKFMRCGKAGDIAQIG